MSKPLDNLLKSLTADIAQDNLAIDSLRTQAGERVRQTDRQRQREREREREGEGERERERER